MRFLPAVALEADLLNNEWKPKQEILPEPMKKDQLGNSCVLENLLYWVNLHISAREGPSSGLFFVLKVSTEVSFLTLEKLWLLLSDVSMDCKQSIYGSVFVNLCRIVNWRLKFSFTVDRLKRYWRKLWIYMGNSASKSNIKLVALYPSSRVCPGKT